MSGRTLSKGDIHLFLAGVFFGTYLLVRFTDPSDYGMTLHPRLDKVWSMWRILITGGWLLLALGLATIKKGDGQLGSLSYSAASATGLGFVWLAIMFPQSSSVFAVAGSLAVYAATSGAICVKIQRPIPAALLGGVLFILQVLTDAVVHFLTGAFRIH
jgi:hypothetical protein